MHFYRVLQANLRVAKGLIPCLLIAVALPVAAQTAPETIEPVQAGLIKARRPTVPDLPPIQPLLPQTSTVRLVLRLTERRVYLYEGEAVKKSYPVAVGKPGWETPTGRFEVMQMLEHPGWTNPLTGEKVPPGPDNPLGERWIAFWTDGTNSIGFHGTPNRESVGRAASHGCVRMLNEHIQEMYEIVQMGTPVTVEL